MFAVMLLTLFQDGSGGETTGLEGAVDAAGDASKEATQETVSLLSTIREFLQGLYDYVTSAEFVGNVLASVIVVFLGLFLFRVLTHGVPRILRWRRRRQDLLDAEAVARIKRQDTAITLIRNALRYVIFFIVALVVLSIFVRNPLPAAAGTTILAAVLGFGAQSFLRDVIAGFSIIFEGQYSVGDFIHVKPQDISGIVEELGLRMTKIRSLSGEVSYIPNGMMQGVTNYVSGQQRFNVEVQLSDAEAVPRVLASLDEAKELYLTPPRLVEREESGGRLRLRILAGVLPSMAWLVEENLTERIKAAAGEESLAAEPLVYKVDQANLRMIRAPVAAQVTVFLSLLAGLLFAFEPLGRRGEKFLDLLQAPLLRRELEDLLPGLQIEIYAAGDREREVPVRRLYLYSDRALRRCLHDPFEQGDTLLRERRHVLLRLLLEVLDLPDVVGFAGEDAVELEAPRTLDQDQHPPVLAALDELHYLRRATHPTRAGLVGQHHPELALLLQALVYHLLVALLEDVQRQRCPRHQHYVQREKRYVGHVLAPLSY